MSRVGGRQRLEKEGLIIVLSDKDNVGVAATDVAAGAIARHGKTQLLCADPIPLGHKVALRRIEEGEKIKKFGVPVGTATEDIGQGRHVHMHNVVSNYITNNRDYYE